MKEKHVSIKQNLKVLYAHKLPFFFLSVLSAIIFFMFCWLNNLSKEQYVVVVKLVPPYVLMDKKQTNLLNQQVLDDLKHNLDHFLEGQKIHYLELVEISHKKIAIRGVVIGQDQVHVFFNHVSYWLSHIPSAFYMDQVQTLSMPQYFFTDQIQILEEVLNIVKSKAYGKFNKQEKNDLKSALKQLKKQQIKIIPPKIISRNYYNYFMTKVSLLQLVIDSLIFGVCFGWIGVFIYIEFVKR